MNALQQLLSQFIAFIPNLFGATLIIVVGYIVSKLVITILKRLLKLIGIDKLGERLNKVDMISQSEVEINLSTVLSQVLFYFMMLVILVAATDVLGLEVVSNLVSSAIAYIPNLVAALVILVIGSILADVLREIATMACRSFAIPAAGMIGSLVFWFVFVAIMLSALAQAKLETDFIVANLSILVAGLALAFALAYGLAARPLMGGFLAHFYNRGKINVGDKIRIENYEGVILSIDRASFTLDANGKLLIIPLSKMQTESVLVLERGNYSDPLLDRTSKK